MTLNQTPGSISILIVDDDEMARLTNRTLCEEVKPHDAILDIAEASNILDALKLIGQRAFQLIILDYDLGPSPDGEGRLTSIPHIHEFITKQPDAEIYVVTAHENLATAVEAVRSGARGYLLKGGAKHTAELRAHELGLAIKHAQLRVHQEIIESRLEDSKSNFVASSPAMKLLRNRLSSLAEIDKPVLFMGETGLGKGAAAKKLNELRGKFLQQTNRPFLAVNMASITKDLAMTELFGYEGSAFTGAKAGGKAGYFDAANGGDLFLDEIGELDLDLQAALLKVIEDKEFIRVGGDKPIKTSARVICATNRDLLQMIQDGTFREDLYMRLATFVIELPTLSQRKTDIPDLAQMILNKIGRETKSIPIKFTSLPQDYIDHLLNDNIPGNIRGLEIELNQIIFNSPKDSAGHPRLDLWRSVIVNRAKPRASRQYGSRMTLEDFMKARTDFVGPEFPGLKQIKQILESKILAEANEKFKTARERSRALKMQESNMSAKYKKIASDSWNENKSEVTSGVI